MPAELGSIDDIYPLLKPEDWPGAGDCVCEQLAEFRTMTLPWVTWGWDEPKQFRFLSKRDLETLGTTREAIAATGRKNLEAAKVSRHPTPIDVPGVGQLEMIAFGGMFAAEKIIDEAFLKKLQEELGVEELLVACPRRAMFLVTPSPADPRLAVAFARGVAGQFRRAESPPISSRVFSVRDGKIHTALAKETDDAERSESVPPSAGARDGASLPEGRAGRDVVSPGRRMRLTEPPTLSAFVWGLITFGLGLIAFVFIDMPAGIVGVALGPPLALAGYVFYLLSQDVALVTGGLSMRRGPVRLLAWEEVEAFTAKDHKTLLVQLSETGRARYVELPRTHIERCDLVIEARFNVDLIQTTQLMNAMVNARASIASAASGIPSRPASLSKGHYDPVPAAKANKGAKAPYEMAMVVREADGRTRIELMVGGGEPRLVAGGAQRFAEELAEKHKWDPEFGGVIHIVVVPTITPDTQELKKELDAVVSELARRFGDKKWRTVDGSQISASWSRGEDHPEAERTEAES